MQFFPRFLRTFFWAMGLGFALLFACNSPKNLHRKGDRYFQQLEYQSAIEAYQKAKARGYGGAALDYSLAEAYRLSNRIGQAAPFYAEALEKDIQEDSAVLHYGFALKARSQYPEAAEQFRQYAAKGRNAKAKVRAKKEADNIAAVQQIAGEKTYFEVRNLHNFNTPQAEFSPVVFNNELIFTASRKDKVYSGTGQGYVGLYKAPLLNDSIVNGQPVLFSETLYAEKLNEGSPTFSRDGKHMIFARSEGKKSQFNEVELYISRFVDGKWSEPEELPISSDKAWDACPAYSGDGKTLYFASNREGGYGGVDLYRATVDAGGRLGRVTNLGPDINTSGNDMFPFVSDDGKLYFSSDGHPGLGGLDLFVAIRTGGKTAIKSLGVPMNSAGDDFGIEYSTPTSGFFSSNREGGKGDDDIYFFEDRTPDLKVVNYYLAGVVIENAGGSEVPLEFTRVKVLENGKELKTFATDFNGRFGTVTLKEGHNYTLLAEKEGYFARREEFSMSGRAIPQELLTKKVTDTTFQVRIPLEKLVVNKVFVIDNILYDYDKADIRPDAAEELDKLVEFLQDNSLIKVELSSHTDDRGSDEYNDKLSQRRAESAVAYIISRGIVANRITAKGYGKRELLVDNAETEEDHQKNRRTEIKVTEITK